ncbi:MAG TPA: UDP-3-O-(3-hydroxymyristoyl)glucosamine N-acyltransferase [Pyrinomonadaceae bacterium]|nr:UDP-3-O-(3-hydroxymyristoyl)glucosamine N-acyltransferase [Pyrinomonadaceae bacterium]
MKVREIAEFVGGRLHGDPEVEITSVADIRTAEAGQMAFIDRPGMFQKTSASCVFIPPDLDPPGSLTCISVDAPKLAFSRVAAILHPPKHRKSEVHKSAIIAEGARVGDGVFIGAYVCVGERSQIGDATQVRAGAKIGDGVHVGKDCVIHPNVSIEDGCTIGNGVILHAGVVIGADGFGYVPDERREHVKFPQIGTVVIEDGVEIGANSCVDRGALGETRIGEGTKIDNLVQIAHNVRIGKRCIIAALSGVSGSSILEDDVVLAGQVGVSDHVVLKQGTCIGAKSAVFPHKIIPGGFWCGIPVEPIRDYKRKTVLLRGLDRLCDDVKNLQRKG